MINDHDRRIAPAADAVLTLDQWIDDHESVWPLDPRIQGLRLLGGRVTWQGAYYPDGCSGHLVCLYRSVHENGQGFTRVSYVDRDTKFRFVLGA